jgi:hypothetical protein
MTEPGRGASATPFTATENCRSVGRTAQAIRLVVAVFCTVLASVVMTPTTNARSTLTAASIESDAGRSRIIVALTDRVQHRIRTTDDARRVIIELPANIRAAAPTVPASNGLIGSVRFGGDAAGSWRIVIDCKRAV